MRRRVALLALLELALLELGGCGQQRTPAQMREAGDAGSIVLASQSIALPDDRAAFPADAAILAQNCTACHSPELILTQPRLKAEVWQTEVAKMRTAYKAAIPEQDDAKIVAALIALQGGPVQK